MPDIVVIRRVILSFYFHHLDLLHLQLKWRHSNSIIVFIQHLLLFLFLLQSYNFLYFTKVLPVLIFAKLIIVGILARELSPHAPLIYVCN